MAESDWKKYYPAFCVPEPELTPERVALVQSSFGTIGDLSAPGLIGRGGEYFGERFYELLFEAYPGVQSMFKDPTKQAVALTGLLRKAIELLDKDIGAVVEELTNLARRHHRYGTLPAHYGPVGETLVKTLTEALGERMDARTAEAWIHLYSTIVTVMLPITFEMTQAAA